MTLKKLIIPAFLAFLLLAMGGMSAFYYFISAPSSDANPVTFTIARGEPVASISEDLEKAGLVRSSWAFRIFVRLSGFEGKIQAGEFSLPRNLPLKDLTFRIARGTSDQKVTFIEGWRIEEIAEHLEKKGVLSKDEFLEVAGSGEFDYDFLPSYSGLDKSHRLLEGYLFPDTYNFAAQSSAEVVINTMLTNFGNRFTAEMKADLSEERLSLSEAVSLASIVEREVRRHEDRPVVAGILVKRLTIPGWRLDVDASIQYAIGSGEEWWPKLTDSARNIVPASPYNTYTHDGLPPTPISNPSLASLRAVIYYEKNDFWFYVSDSDGVMHFAKTIDEQNENIGKYLR